MQSEYQNGGCKVQQRKIIKSYFLISSGLTGHTHTFPLTTHTISTVMTKSDWSWSVKQLILFSKNLSVSWGGNLEAGNSLNLTVTRLSVNIPG